MPENETPADHWMPSRIARGIVVAAAVVIVLAGMRAASSILVPFLVSAFVALICIPPLLWLQKKGLPSWAAVLVVIFALLGGVSMVGTLVGTSLTEFYRALPSYQARFLQLTIEVEADMLEWGWNIPDGMLTDVFSPGAVMRTAASVLSALSGLLTNAFVILLTVLFVLAEASSLPRKLRASMADPVASFSHIEEITRNVNQYLAIKTLISVITGVAATIWLEILVVDFAVLWGLLTFCLNYIPNIGSIIAAVPPVLLALVQYGPGTALAVAIGYVVINVVLGNLVEPRVMGRGLGLSTLVVFISLVFWQWVLGPVGMLLSVPLTMTLKIILDGNDETRWIAILLSSSSEVRRAEQEVESDDSDAEKESEA